MGVARDDPALLRIVDGGQGAVQPLLEAVQVLVMGWQNARCHEDPAQVADSPSVHELVESVVGDRDRSIGQPAQEVASGRAPGQPGADATGPFGAFPPGKQRDKLRSDVVSVGQ